MVMGHQILELVSRCGRLVGRWLLSVDNFGSRHFTVLIPARSLHSQRVMPNVSDSDQ